MHEITRNKLLLVTYMLTILFALHYGVPLYATSTYLHEFFNSSHVSALYLLGSIGAIIASFSVSKSIKKFHAYYFTAGIAITEIVVTILFGLTHNTYLLGLLFIVHFILQVLLFICLNVFIESFSKFADTGSIRGLFLALFSTAILLSPLIGGTLLTHTSFEILYITSALMLLPFLFFLRKYLSHIKDPAYHATDSMGALSATWHNKNLRAALVGSLVLNCFYAVMIIYSPIYLGTLGISLSVYLTFILPLALIPLVILPYELGYLADSRFGEKELLIGGLLILAITTFLCVIVTSSSPLVWILILTTARVGAACVETMVFTYYFKKVGPEDSSLTALFGGVQITGTAIVGAVGFMIAPLLVERPQLIFIILGCAILFSVYYVLPMKDTR